MNETVLAQQRQNNPAADLVRDLFRGLSASGARACDVDLFATRLGAT